MTVTDGESTSAEKPGENDPTEDLASPRDLLEDLVSIPSPSGEEREVARRLVDYFRNRGRDARIDEVGNVRAPGDDAVLLTSHLDTVPGEIPVEVGPADPTYDHEVGDGAALWGRGSVDATGPLAAMAVVAARTGVSFAGVVREETDSLGARRLVADRDGPDAVINGEPSGWSAMVLGYRGFLAGRYEVTTPGRHTSRPEPNAIETAMAWWNAVDRTLASTGDRQSNGTDDPDDRPAFESVTATPVGIDGGATDDGLSNRATVEFQVRVPPGRDPGEIRRTIEDAGEDGAVSWNRAATVPPLVESPRNPVARAFRAAIRAEGDDPGMVRKTGTADANLYADAWDCPVVTYGPGDSTLDHAPNEHLPLAEFDRSVAVLEAVARRCNS